MLSTHGTHMGPPTAGQIHFRYSLQLAQISLSPTTNHYISGSAQILSKCTHTPQVSCILWVHSKCTHDVQFTCVLKLSHNTTAWLHFHCSPQMFSQCSLGERSWTDHIFSINVPELCPCPWPGVTFRMRWMISPQHSSSDTSWLHSKCAHTL